MGKIISSGNMNVDAIGRINLSGTLIPHSWLHSITTEKGHPDMNAILILAEIVYWYRPTASVNADGETVWKKKFRKDLLQKSTRELAEKLNLSHGQTKQALARLEKSGLIRKHVKPSEIINGRKYGNVMYIEPVSEEIRRITKKAADVSGNERDTGPQYTESQGSVHEKQRVSIQIPEAWGSETPSPQYTDVPTNTKNTDTESTTKDFTSIIDVREEFKSQIDYESLMQDHPLRRNQIEEIVELAVEILTSQKQNIPVNGEPRDTAYVKARFRKLNILSIKYVLESLARHTGGTVNTRAFLITTLFNAPVTMDSYYELAANHELKNAN